MEATHVPQQSQPTADSGNLVPRVTIFSLPKPFVADSDRIQRNAIGSWKRLAPSADVLLIGDEDGIGQYANEVGVSHVADVKTNAHGTPLLDDAFSIATQYSQSDVLIYCNADVILDQNFIKAVGQLATNQCVGNDFLAIGRRTDVWVDKLIDYSEIDMEKLIQQFKHRGTDASIACKEFFAFRRGTFDQIPAFAVGRGNWDNWMVASAKQNGIPVISISEVAPVFHQRHDYSHIEPNAADRSSAFQTRRSDRMNCYVSGAEARENQRLASGRNIINGSTATWRLTERGLTKNRLHFLQWEFWCDLPRFAVLIGQLLSARRKK